jgi:hypothetical protein
MAPNHTTFYAEYHEAQRVRHGILLLTTEGTAHFLDEALGTWRDLTRADVPRVVQLGRCDIADLALYNDGDKVRRCSRTVQAA